MTKTMAKKKKKKYTQEKLDKCREAYRGGILSAKAFADTYGMTVAAAEALLQKGVEKDLTNWTPGQPKLTEEEVVLGRTIFNDRTVTVQDLAARFGVSDDTVVSFLKGRTYTNFGGPLWLNTGKDTRERADGKPVGELDFKELPTTPPETKEPGSCLEESLQTIIAATTKSAETNNQILQLLKNQRPSPQEEVSVPMLRDKIKSIEQDVKAQKKISIVDVGIMLCLAFMCGFGTFWLIQWFTHGFPK